MTTNTINPVMYYDGDCGLCARSVQWCLNHDKRGVLNFAPLQGATYAKIEDLNKPTEVSSMVISQGEQLFVKSTAVLRMLQLVGGMWGIFGSLGFVIPRFIRDACYDFVARRRVAWFGEAKFCHLPSSSQRARFLD
jgi:predicted DCC family thiol-disulfide oxidoreductase YuxK